MGISSILLAQKYDVTVFAADLWISPTENAKRFASLGLDSKIFPFLVDATKEMSFAKDYFDMIISVDSYHYFGHNESMLGKLLPFVKKGGYVAVAVPGFIQDFPEGQLPKEIKPFWTPEWYFYSCPWWRALWEKESGIEIIELREMDSCKQAWDDWLKSPSPYAQNDIVMMEAGAGKYFNIIQMIGRKCN
jgi:cyclopropane fatty-acyl-phospholipid synthase-like methyltransferase